MEMEKIIQLKENERVDSLQIKNMKIIQNKEGFCFGIDSVLLSDFAKGIKGDSRIVDLGTGTGILGILLCAKTNLSEIVGIEIQEEVADMAQRSIRLNHLENKFKVLNLDIKEIENNSINYSESKKNNNSKVISNLKKNSFDYVITNPPYKELNTGKVNEDEKKLISRHELKADLKDFIQVSNYLLKDKGTLFMVHRPERLVDVIEKMRQQKIEPKEIRFVYPKINQRPNLILIKGVKNAKPFLTISKPLYIYNSKGDYTSEILEIYGKK